MFGFRKARARLRLDAANRAFAAAYAARLAAEAEPITQAIGHTRAALQRARTEQVAAELAYAAFSKPDRQVTA